jgi:tetratricopeptide (TPR) repeat protein
MNRKLLGALCLIQLLSHSASALAEEHLCPDLHEHQQVLDAGKKLQRSGGGPIESIFGGALMSIPRGGGVKDYSPTQREHDLRANLSWLNENVSVLPLESQNQIKAAESYARQYEELGMYSQAALLYERLLKNVDKKGSPEATSRTADFQRARMCSEIRLSEISSKNFSKAIDKLNKIVKGISVAEIDLYSKSQLLKRAKFTLIDRLAQLAASNSGVSSDEVAKYRKLTSHADELLTSWKRELQCLGMASELDRTAFKLETQGEYEMAERLYRQSQAIKAKNLGAESNETLAQYADFARLCSARGHNDEAIKYYEIAVQELRKKANQDRTYISILESYGDLLDRTNHKAEADKIYEEARIANEKFVKHSEK